MNEKLNEELSGYISVFNRKKDFKADYERDLKIAANLNDEMFRQCGYNAGNFTSHGPDHSARMLKFAIEICKANKKLSAYDYYVLGLAIILHDLGMTASIPDEYTSYTDEEKWHIRRERHANEIQNILTLKQTELGTIKSSDPVLYNFFLPTLCKSHATANFKLCVGYLIENRDMDKRGTKYPFLAGVLLLSDELDISKERTPETFPMLNEFSDKTLLHWYKHFVIDDCKIKGSKIIIKNVSDQSIKHAGLLVEWVEKKIEHQRKLIVDTIDPTHESIFDDFVINKIQVNRLPQNFPPLKNKVVYQLKSELYKLGVINEILMPRQLKENIVNFNEHKPSSQFYNDIISPNLPLFRGKGNLESPDAILRTYVLVDENIRILEMLEKDICGIVQKRKNLPIVSGAGEPFRGHPEGRIKQARNIRILTGEIGIGKTHLLNYFHHTFDKKHNDIYNQVIFIKCECTDESSLSEIKRNIAKLLIEELKRLGLFENLKDYYKDKNVKIDIPTRIAPHMSEIDIDNLLEFIGETICEYNSQAIFNTENPPRAIALFLDNSDQIELSVLSDVYDWCYKNSSDVFSYCVMFFRPNIYDQIFYKKQSEKDYTTSRDSNIIKPALSQMILRQRVDYLFCDESNFRNKKADVDFLETKITNQIKIENVQFSLKQLCKNVTVKSSYLLPSFVDTNGRQLLELFTRILGSWKLKSEILFVYSISLVSEATQNADEDIYPWYELLECLMLGNRAWYDSSVSPVTNIFNPPGIRFESDYFIALHILQILAEIPDNKVNIQELKEKLNTIGYNDLKVDRTLKWMGFLPNDIDFPRLNKKAFSLVRFYNRDGQPILNDDFLADNVSVAISNCGKYHLENIIYSTAFWRYGYYEIIVPGDFPVGFEKFSNDEKVMKILEYLESKEALWFDKYFIDKSIPIKKVFPSIKKFEKFLTDNRSYKQHSKP